MNSFDQAEQVVCVQRWSFRQNQVMQLMNSLDRAELAAERQIVFMRSLAAHAARMHSCSKDSIMQH